MTDTAFGPQGPYYTTVRPPADPKASGGADTWFKNCTAAGAKDGTFATADFFNVHIANLRYLVRTAGVVLDDSDDTMLYQAVRAAGRAYYGADQGVVNAIKVDLPGVTTVTEGLVILVKIAFSNTAGGVSLNVNSLGALPVRHSDQSILNAGELNAGGIASFVFDGAVWQLSWQTRQPGAPTYLQADQTLYVNALTGNDTYDGLSATVAAGHGPLQTLQAAANVIAKFNLNGYSVYVNVADGNYAGVILSQPGGNGTVFWTGNAVTPSNVQVTGNNRSAVTITGGPHRLRGFKLTTTGSPSVLPDPMNGVNILDGANVYLRDMHYGSVHGSHIAVSANAQCHMAGAHVIAGGAAGNTYTPSTFLLCSFAGQVLVASTDLPALTITTAVAYQSFVNAINNAVIGLTFSSITGAANVSGSRYTVSANGVVNTSGAGANYFPGTTPGTTSTGGQYV